MGNINMTNQDLVNNYLENNNITPLFFSDYTGKEKKFSGKQDSLPLSELIERILVNTGKFYSCCNDVETTPNRWRSSVDIWRHVIYFQPDATIFEVMRILYSMQNILFTRYCPNVRRRVFKLRSSLPENTHWLYGVNGVYFLDEYGLNFTSWKKIGE